MSAMSNLYTEMELDFERLSNTSMAWSEETWGDQAKEGRFTGTVNFEHRYIYWFEHYANLMAARAILKEFDIDYSIMFDSYSDTWALTSTYQSIEWRAA